MQRVLELQEHMHNVSAMEIAEGGELLLQLHGQASEHRVAITKRNIMQRVRHAATNMLVKRRSPRRKMSFQLGSAHPGQSQSPAGVSTQPQTGEKGQTSPRS
jgi:hypothetical protein